MKEIVVVILVIYFYSTSQHGLASANDKSIGKNRPSKTDITENNERTFYMGHRRPLYFDRKQRAEKYKFPHQIRRLNTKFDKPRMEGGIISRKHALPGARNRNHKMNSFRQVKAVPSSKAGGRYIASGTKASEGQFPYQVSLWETDMFFCGGSIINEQWVLTGGRCVVFRKTRHITVVTGTNVLMSGGETYKVVTFIFHSGFNTEPSGVDLALIKINGKIAFNARVQPIPLDTSDVRAGADLKISGWGLTSNTGEHYYSDDLLFLDTKAISNKECNKRLSSKGMSVVDTQLCTFTKRGQGVCLRDAGGPLTQKGKLVGISSWEMDCAVGYPDVYTPISPFVDWIRKTTH